MTKDNRTLNVFGDLSYPLYLIHGLIIVALLWMGWPNHIVYYIKSGYAGWVILSTIIGVTLIASLLVHLAVEKTVAHLMRSTVESYRTKPAPVQLGLHLFNAARHVDGVADVVMHQQPTGADGTSLK
jgi:peptidoglycan/LPS O-acetylase OafA/YrhL